MRKFNINKVSKTDQALLSSIINSYLFHDKGDRKSMTNDGITRILEIYEGLMDDWTRRNVGSKKPDEWDKWVEECINKYRSNQLD